MSEMNKAEIVKAHARGTNDTGSPEVQVALLTARINELTPHFKANPKVIQAVTGDDALLRNLEKLRNKRLDAVVEDQAVLAYTINEKNWQSHYKDAGCERSVTPSGLHIAFSPKHPKAREYAKLLQDEVTAMRADGRLKALLAKYGVPDWQ